MRMTIAALALLLFLLPLCRAAVVDDVPKAPPAPAAWPFFAFCHDTHDAKKRSLAEQAALLKELGYDGAGHLWLGQVPERLKTLDEAGLKLYQVYVQIDLAPGKQAFDPKLKEVAALLKGRDTQIAVLVAGLGPSDPAGDARAVEGVRQIADIAREAGLKVVLYPHSGFWLEKVEDALRVVKKADRPNLGVMFNLCHWLKVDEEKNLRPLLTAAMPYLWAVSIHGADKADEIHAGKGNWIQPLGSGSFDVPALLALLKELGYKGPIGLQCYGIGGDAREHLARSMAAWKKMNEKPAEAK